MCDSAVLISGLLGECKSVIFALRPYDTSNGNKRVYSVATRTTTTGGRAMAVSGSFGVAKRKST